VCLIRLTRGGRGLRLRAVKVVVSLVLCRKAMRFQKLSLLLDLTCQRLDKLRCLRKFGRESVMTRTKQRRQTRVTCVLLAVCLDQRWTHGIKGSEHGTQGTEVLVFLVSAFA